LKLGLKIGFSIVVFTVSVVKLYAQKNAVDTSYVNHLSVMAQNLRNANPDSCILLSKQIIAASHKLNYTAGEASGYLWEGTAVTNLSNYDEAIVLLNKSIALFSKIKRNKKQEALLARAYNNLGNVYWYKGNYPEALNYLLISLRLKEKINDLNGMASSYNNIGNIYSQQGNFTEALENYAKSIKIFESFQNKKGVAETYTNIGLVYYSLVKYDKAIESYDAALKISYELNDKTSIAIALSNLALVYVEQKRYDDAFTIQQKSLKIKEEIGDLYGAAISMVSLGSMLEKQKKYKEAKKYFEQSLKISSELGTVEEMKTSYEGLYLCNLGLNNFKDAYLNYKSYIQFKDSLTNESNIKKQTQIEMGYAFDKKQATDSIRNAEHVKSENLKHAQKINQQKVFTYIGIAGFFLMLVVALVSIRAYRQKQKANSLIAQQKHLVEEKQKEILDSIHYAKRIQQALLPSEKMITRKFNELKK